MHAKSQIFHLLSFRNLVVSCLTFTWLLSANPVIDAGGFGGRGGGRSPGGAGPGNMGGNRPSPNSFRPNNAARPNFGAAPANMANRPSFGGGMMPSQRPQTSMPHLGASTNRPSVGNAVPNLPNRNRPQPSANTKLPPQPSANTKLPPQPGRNPFAPENTLGNRPVPLPDRLPATSRPGTANRPPSIRPSLPDFGTLPNGRPSEGELGGFLGINPSSRPATPLRPGNATTLPGSINTNRPDLQRPLDRPRPPERPGLSNRPRPNDQLPANLRPSINIGDVNLGNNTAISNRPSWANIDNDRIGSINQRWQTQFGNATTLPALNPDRTNHFHDWGNQVRDHWARHSYSGYFRPNWWTNHPFHCSGWHYFYSYSSYPYTYWWSTPTYNDVTTWFTWNAPAASWQQPVYYDYGMGGNVTYQDNSVYIGDSQIASGEEFAASAATLATVSAPQSTQVAQESEWLPLGTFALTTDARDVDPSRIIQLAVNRQGIVSGTLYNKLTDQTQAIQGRVDKETQRVAFRIGESENVVAETGLYNLTKDEASILVHFGTETHDTYLLVRLPSPEDPASEK